MEINAHRILIAPLAWGLGHATRCVPLIRKFRDEGKSLAIASDGPALEFLQKEFPTVPFYELCSYQIHYPTSSSLINMTLMAPRMIRAIRKEHKQLGRISREWNPELIISDSRFGCYHPNVRSVIISHQIQIQHLWIPARFIGRKLNYYWINRFDECWIPDFEEPEKRLAGELSDPDGICNPRYIGPLSRMIKLDLTKKWDAVAVLSGPEPQRSMLEKLLLEIFESFPSKSFGLIRGVNNPVEFRPTDNVSIFDCLQTEELNQIMCASKLVICRSGYSSIMDLSELEIPALLIPTPGQTEQEYLGEYHKGKIYHVVTQDKGAIQRALGELI